MAKWQDLQELVSEGLCSETQIDRYLSDLPSDQVCFQDFADFVEKLQDVDLEDLSPQTLESLMAEASPDTGDDTARPEKKIKKMKNNDKKKSSSNSSNGRKK